jgi:hypothetical protein
MISSTSISLILLKRSLLNTYGTLFSPLFSLRSWSPSCFTHVNTFFFWCVCVGLVDLEWTWGAKQGCGLFSFFFGVLDHLGPVFYLQFCYVFNRLCQVRWPTLPNFPSGTMMVLAQARPLAKTVRSFCSMYQSFITLNLHITLLSILISCHAMISRRVMVDLAESFSWNKRVRSTGFFSLCV